MRSRKTERVPGVKHRLLLARLAAAGSIDPDVDAEGFFFLSFFLSTVVYLNAANTDGTVGAKASWLMVRNLIGPLERSSLPNHLPKAAVCGLFTGWMR